MIMKHVTRKDTFKIVFIVTSLNTHAIRTYSILLENIASVT